MPDDNSGRTERAPAAKTSELSSLIHDTDEQALLALLENPAVEEPHIIQMLERLDLSANVLAAIAEKGSGRQARACACASRGIHGRRADMLWRCFGSFTCSIWFA